MKHPLLKSHFEFIQKLEAKTLAAEEFTHLAHIRAAWFYLNQADLKQCSWSEACTDCCDNIKQLAISLGASDKYNHTISVAMMKIVNQRLQLLEAKQRTCWSLFIKNNKDLIEHGLEILLSYYDERVLFSNRAKQSFITPKKDFND